jgi:hypothetical protein
MLENHYRLCSWDGGILLESLVLQSIVTAKITIFNRDPVINGRWNYFKGKAKIKA